MNARLRWATVELQTDLQHAKDPVRLGIVVQRTARNGHVRTESMVVGRVPNPESRPSEVGDNPALFDMLIRWPEAITQAVLQTPPDKDPLDELPKTWRWNIYVAEIKEKPVTMDMSIEELALELVHEFIPDMQWEFSSQIENQVAQEFSSVGQDVARWGFERIMRQRELPHQSVH